MLKRERGTRDSKVNERGAAAAREPADPFAELMAFNDEMFAKYGLMPDSTPQIRRDRESR